MRRTAEKLGAVQEMPTFIKNHFKTLPKHFYHTVSKTEARKGIWTHSPPGLMMSLPSVGGVEAPAPARAALRTFLIYKPSTAGMSPLFANTG